MDGISEVPQDAEEEEDVVPPGMDTEDRDEEIKAQIMQAAADNNRNAEAESNGYDPEDELREQQEESHVGDTSDDTDEESQRGYGRQYNAMPMSNNFGSEYYQVGHVPIYMNILITLTISFYKKK